MTVLRRANRFASAATSQALRDERKSPDSQWLPPAAANELREYARERDELIVALFALICTLRRKADA